MRCAAVRRRLPRADDERLIPARAARHVSACLGCRAQQARYLRLRRDLAGLRADLVAPPPGLVPAVVSAIPGPTAAEPSRTRRVAAAGAVVAAAGMVAAGAVAGVVLGRRGGSVS